ncbi:MAG: cobalamin-dependent protein, partial [Chloroflexi bacterium]|nr:cobalamin-dependent protein [Chloroflexota bacterium]
MRILLTSSNRSNVISPVFPLGLAYMAGSLCTIGHEIKSFDVALHKDYKKLLIETIKDFNPDIIGISIRNLDNQKYADPVSFLPEISDVVNICKESSKAKIILGGSAFSILPERLLDFLNMDIGIVGEGEKVILKLLQAMSDGTDYSKIH